MSELITNYLRDSEIDIGQVSIKAKIDYEQILDFFYVNVNKIERFLTKKDNYSNDLINGIKNKKIIFPINKHIEYYIIKNKENLKKVCNYLLFRYKFYLAGHNKTNFGYPPYLLIEPVSACNLRCPFCFQIDKSFTKKPYMGVMNYDFFKKIVDEANNIGVGAITLASRGEPTLHKKLGEMIEYISKKKNIFEIKINSNGTFLNENLCHNFFKNEISQLVISADHYLKDEYERLRKGAIFEKIVKNVDMLFSIKKNFYPNSITEIRISGIDNERNLDRKKFHDFWIKRSDHVTAGYPSERWDTYNNAPHPEINDPCQNLWDRMYVWFDGKVNPCDPDYKSYLSFGNLKENTILEVWNNKSIEMIRNKHLNEDRKTINPCNKCGISFCQ